MTPPTVKWLDMFERTGWTFVQALAASVYAAGQGSDFTQINCPVALTGAAIAALLALLKVLGVNASQSVYQIISAAALIEQQQGGPAAARAARAPQHERVE